MSNRHDAISGGVLVAISVLYFLGAAGLPAGEDEPGPRFFPLLLAFALALLGLSILFQGLARRSISNERSQREPGHAFGKPGLAIVVTALYVVSFEVLGFSLSTWLYTLSVTILFRRDRVLEPAVVPIVSTLLIYFLLHVGLGVRLPVGHWG